MNYTYWWHYEANGIKIKIASSVKSAACWAIEAILRENGLKSDIFFSDVIQGEVLKAGEDHTGTIEKTIKSESKYVGMANENNELVLASECNSQIESSDYDGPVLWRDQEQAEEAIAETGGLPKGHSLVEVTVKYEVNKYTPLVTV